MALYGILHAQLREQTAKHHRAKKQVWGLMSTSGLGRCLHYALSKRFFRMEIRELSRKPTQPRCPKPESEVKSALLQARDVSMHHDAWSALDALKVSFFTPAQPDEPHCRALPKRLGPKKLNFKLFLPLQCFGFSWSTSSGPLAE